MQPQVPFDKSPKKSLAPKVLLATVALIVIGGGYWFSQSNRKGETMDTAMSGTQSKHVEPGYLDQNDPMFISIKGRAVTDLKQSTERQDPESPENKSLAAQAEAWPEEKQNQIFDLMKKSIDDYMTQTLSSQGNSDLNFTAFMMVVQDFRAMDQKKIFEEHDIRVQYLGGDKYVAELWQDGLAVYAEKNVPDNERKVVASERYAIARKSIEDGQQERYTKMMTLLYTRGSDGSVTFRDPLQPVYDFVKSNTASGGEVNR